MFTGQAWCVQIAEYATTPLAARARVSSLSSAGSNRARITRLSGVSLPSGSRDRLKSAGRRRQARRCGLALLRAAGELCVLCAVASARTAIRRSPGTASMGISCRLPSNSAARILVPVVLRSGRTSESTNPSPTNVLSDTEDRNSFSRLLYPTNGRAPTSIVYIRPHRPTPSAWIAVSPICSEHCRRSAIELDHLAMLVTPTDGLESGLYWPIDLDAYRRE